MARLASRSGSVGRGSVLLLTAVVFVAAGCSDGGAGESSVSLAPSDSIPTESTPVPDEESAADVPAGPATSDSVPSDSVPSDPEELDTSAPSSTSGEWRQMVDAMCESFANDGFESRSARLDEYVAVAADDADAAVEELTTVCGEDLERLREGQRILTAAQDLAADPDPVSLTSVRCADGAYSFIAENTSDAALGIHIAFRIFEADDSEPRSSADYPIVIWELEPGDRQGITGEFEEPPTSDYRCNLSARVFIAEPGPAGAGIPGTGAVDRQGDDPTEWIGALLEDETLAIGSGDIDAAASTEDLRSLFYDDVVEAVMSGSPTDRVPIAVTICTAAVDQPDPDRMSVVYHITYRDGDDEESFLRHGLFRRGSDGVWRWLSAAQYFESSDFESCASG